ncbi:MAG: translation initiation factor IF-2, partial [Pirellulaceae bacterium]
MPVRIYTLAKDLKLDSKELVDLCNKIGITGKGSALASLEDEEVLRIKKHLESASAAKTEERPAPSQAPATPAAPVRGSGFVGRPQIIPPRRKPTSTSVEESAPAEIVDTVEPVVGEV